MRENAIDVLKSNFSDCTFGGDDKDFVMYDVGLYDAFANVDIYESKISVRVYSSEEELLEDKDFSTIEELVPLLKKYD